ncbi:arginase family protein [Sphingomonas gei]|uniref:Arginase family protein n=1 Tax=Sphingomonas gei TaxID=1395960 RepID=A0A4S1X8I3_9SPHN|nr:arginase family protein [Sphingomonas gei]TGX52431.1 arginase family protein [Sphingomonas gei]
MTGSEAPMDVPVPPASLFGWPGCQHVSPEIGALCAIGAPTDHGNVISRGASRGPAAIRRASLQLPELRLDGLDIGDVDRSDGPDPQRYLDRIAAVTQRIRERGLCPLLLGGDHSITYAPVSTLHRSRELCLIWFDAHTDFSPWSGQNFHNHKQVLRRISKLGGVSRIVQIGYRGITAGDERSLGAKSVVVTTSCARELDAQALLALVPYALPCYISIDIDVIDPLWAPGTSAPVPDGLLPDQLKGMLQTLVRHREILGVDLVEVNPVLDLEAATSRVAADLLHGIAEHWVHQRLRRSAPAGDAAFEAFAVAPVACETTRHGHPDPIQGARNAI